MSNNIQIAIISAIAVIVLIAVVRIWYIRTISEITLFTYRDNENCRICVNCGNRQILKGDEYTGIWWEHESSTDVDTTCECYNHAAPAPPPLAPEMSKLTIEDLIKTNPHPKTSSDYNIPIGKLSDEEMDKLEEIYGATIMQYLGGPLYHIGNGVIVNQRGWDYHQAMLKQYHLAKYN